MILQTIIQVAIKCGWRVEAIVRGGRQHDIRLREENGKRGAVPILHRHDRQQPGDPCRRHSVICRCLPSGNLRTGMVSPRRSRREPQKSDRRRHGRHTLPCMASCRSNFRSLRQSGKQLAAVVSAELSGHSYLLRRRPRLTGGLSRMIMRSLPLISLCQPFSDRWYGSIGGEDFMYSYIVVWLIPSNLLADITEYSSSGTIFLKSGSMALFLPRLVRAPAVFLYENFGGLHRHIRCDADMIRPKGQPVLRGNLVRMSDVMEEQGIRKLIAAFSQSTGF